MSTKLRAIVNVAGPEKIGLIYIKMLLQMTIKCNNILPLISIVTRICNMHTCSSYSMKNSTQLTDFYNTYRIARYHNRNRF